MINVKKDVTYPPAQTDRQRTDRQLQEWGNHRFYIFNNLLFWGEGGGGGHGISWTKTGNYKSITPFRTLLKLRHCGYTLQGICLCDCILWLCKIFLLMQTFHGREVLRDDPKNGCQGGHSLFGLMQTKCTCYFAGNWDSCVLS